MVSKFNLYFQDSELEDFDTIQKILAKPDFTVHVVSFAAKVKKQLHFTATEIKKVKKVLSNYIIHDEAKMFLSNMRQKPKNEVATDPKNTYDVNNK